MPIEDTCFLLPAVGLRRQDLQAIGGRGPPPHGHARFTLEALGYVKSNSEDDKGISCRPATLSFNTLGTASDETYLEALKCRIIVKYKKLMLTYREPIVVDENAYFVR